MRIHIASIYAKCSQVLDLEKLATIGSSWNDL